MPNERFRVPVDEPYVHALGIAAYCFACCEWNAVWSAERLQDGYISTIERSRKTAGIIANELINLVNNKISNPSLRNICLAPSKEFKILVEKRNRLLHGKPATAPNGDQRLFHDGHEWTISEVNLFADEVTVCSSRLNEMKHTHLKMD